MFINCPYCKALVATDPATDVPPEHCPRCAAPLRESRVENVDPVASSPSLLQTPIDDTAALADVPADAPVDAPVDAPANEPAQADAPSIPRFPDSDRIAIHEAAVSAPSTPPAQATSVIASLAARLRKPAPARIAAATPPPADAVQADPGIAATPAVAEPLQPPAVDNATVDTTAPVDATPAQAAASAPLIDDNETAETEAGTEADVGMDIDAGTPLATPAATTDHPDPAAIADPVIPATPAAPSAKALPSFAHAGSAIPHRGFSWKSTTVITALALLLLLQLLLADRAQLAADARWRPVVTTACSVLGCNVPTWHQPTAFTLLARDVRPLAAKPGALRATATFRNDARWPQAWPRLQLTLSDVDGNPVATRDFSPRDYLGAAPSTAEIASGQSATIAIDLVEPGPRSVAFDFQLH